MCKRCSGAASPGPPCCSVAGRSDRSHWQVVLVAVAAAADPAIHTNSGLHTLAERRTRTAQMSSETGKLAENQGEFLCSSAAQKVHYLERGHLPAGEPRCLLDVRMCTSRALV